MSRITAAFERLKAEGRGGFIPFITAGDPDLETTRRLLVELARAGADVIELGVPFSDPMADGPVIQRASERALRHRAGVADILAVVAEARAETDVPVLLFSYFNPLLQYGVHRLAKEAREAGVDGVLITDVGPDNDEAISDALIAEGLDQVFLAAPTSTAERLEMIARRSRGFVYAVSRAGVTGPRESLSGEARRLVERLRRAGEMPVAVGFGISSPEQVAEVWQFADAAVCGSAIVAAIEKHLGAPDLVDRVARFARSLVPAGAPTLTSGGR